MAGQADTFSKLKGAIDKIPLVDGHARSLIQSHEPSPDFPRETLASFANGDALKDSVHSLAHIRMVRHLSRFFGLPIGSSWQAVIEAAKARDYISLCRDFVKAAGIQAILIDDGIQNDHCHAISWHDQLTPTPNKRIVQIESLFESIVAQSGRTEALLYFPAAIRRLVKDPEVVGFNSIAAYRVGLDIQPLDPEGLALACERAHREVRDYPPGPFRVESYSTVAWLVNTTCSAISGKGKPLQFQTGSDVNRLSLAQSDASLLQSLIQAYPNVSFVLLYSGYPYARQARYLATAYPNVYLDFGLAISLLSGDGQRNLIRQLLELCPTNKLLWSSGAAFHPERFYLGALQTREALTEILADYVGREEIGFEDAIQVAKRMLFENANKLYKLNIDYVELGLERTTEIQDYVNEKKNDEETNDEANAHSAKPSALNNLPEPVKPKTSLLEVLEPSQVSGTSSETISTLMADLKSRGIKFVRIAWVDYVNFTRYRAVSIERLTKLIDLQPTLSPSSHPSECLTEYGPSVGQAALGMQISGEHTPGVNYLAQHDLKPDFSAFWTVPFAQGHAYVMGQFFHKVNTGGIRLEMCPRTILHQVVWQAERELDVKFLVNFKTGFTLFRERSRVQTRTPSSSNLHMGPVADCVHEIIQSIVDAGIELYTYDAKSTNNQYEIVASPLPPMQAADVLVMTREIIYHTAQKYNLRASLLPRLYSSQASAFSQVHVSVQSASSNIPSNHPDVPSLPNDLAYFMAGILTHLGSTCMFTLPLDGCYPRVISNPLNASMWACWSTENIEAPLRLSSSEQGKFHLEFNAFDGAANPFLGLAAILGAGLTGLKKRIALEMRNYQNAPSAKTTHAEDWRNNMRITRKMPTANEVFEPDSNERSEFIKSWLPEEAWNLYKSVQIIRMNGSFTLQTLMGQP